jgi:hypothetical protein
MTQTFIITDDQDEIDSLEDMVSIKPVTPEEAVGLLVSFEKPGTMGRDPYHIEEVNMENKVTTVSHALTGHTTKVGDGSLPPDWNHLSSPHIGEEWTVWWIEHRNGRGEWVKTRGPIGGLQDEQDAQRYRQKYKGHEKTRVVSNTLTYYPENIIPYDILCEVTDNSWGWELTIPREDCREELEQLDDVFSQINTDAVDAFSQVGTVYVDEELGEIVNFKIKEPYRAGEVNVVDLLENYRL